MSRVAATPAIFAALLLLPGPAAADIYRYVDKRGNEYYTNVQPKGKGWQRIYKNRSAARRRAHEAIPSGARGRVGTPDPERYTRYDAHLREAAELYNLPEPFLRAVMRVESDFQQFAVSQDGAMGLMQLMPATAQGMGVVDPFDPRQNVLGGARFLRTLANRFDGDLVMTIAGYNAGPGAVLKYNGVPPYRETRRYVTNVMKHYEQYVAEARTQAMR